MKASGIDHRCASPRTLTLLTRTTPGARALTTASTFWIPSLLEVLVMGELVVPSSLSDLKTPAAARRCTACTAAAEGRRSFPWAIQAWLIFSPPLSLLLSLLLSSPLPPPPPLRAANRQRALRPKAMSIVTSWPTISRTSAGTRSNAFSIVNAKWPKSAFKCMPILLLTRHSAAVKGVFLAAAAADAGSSGADPAFETAAIHADVVESGTTREEEEEEEEEEALMNSSGSFVASSARARNSASTCDMASRLSDERFFRRRSAAGEAVVRVGEAEVDDDDDDDDDDDEGFGEEERREEEGDGERTPAPSSQ
mmetsp:Transcript_25464/g.46285  ORF Transcript_25464/g.46285 Transcript_25464/m.46285 type:complete len:310 (-) Transcript_25464:772-1701(-)